MGEDSEKASLLTPQTWASSLWNCEKINCCCLATQAGGYFAMAALANEYNSCAALGKSLTLSEPQISIYKLSSPYTGVITKIRINVCDTY